MKLTNKISWLMGRVQKSLRPQLDECFDSPPTEHEKRPVSILEIVMLKITTFSVLQEDMFKNNGSIRYLISVY